MKKTKESTTAAMFCTPLVPLVDEAGGRYLYDLNLSRSLPVDKNFRAGECMHLGALDCRCLYRRLQDHMYKRMSDGLVVTFSSEDTDMNVLPTTQDEELSDAAYCAKYGIVGVSRYANFGFGADPMPKYNLD